MSNSHFSVEAEGTPPEAGRFVDVDDIDPVSYVEGLQFRPVIGQSLLTNFVTWEPNSEAPMHCHEEEQHILVLEGRFWLTIGDETREMVKGDYAVIPSWTLHGGKTGAEPCVEIDIFTPPRISLVDHAVAQRRTVSPVRDQPVG